MIYIEFTAYKDALLLRTANSVTRLLLFACFPKKVEVCSRLFAGLLRGRAPAQGSLNFEGLITAVRPRHDTFLPTWVLFCNRVIAVQKDFHTNEH